jgi:hypothetical protein
MMMAFGSNIATCDVSHQFEDSQDGRNGRIGASSRLGGPKCEVSTKDSKLQVQSSKSSLQPSLPRLSGHSHRNMQGTAASCHCSQCCRCRWVRKVELLLLNQRPRAAENLNSSCGQCRGRPAYSYYVHSRLCIVSCVQNTVPTQAERRRLTPNG